MHKWIPMSEDGKMPELKSTWEAKDATRISQDDETSAKISLPRSTVPLNE